MRRGRVREIRGWHGEDDGHVIALKEIGIVQHDRVVLSCFDLVESLPGFLSADIREKPRDVRAM